MTNEQRQVLKQQVTRVHETKRAADREMRTLHAMLVMHDARFADPQSGLVFDEETMEIVDAQATG